MAHSVHKELMIISFLDGIELMIVGLLDDAQYPYKTDDCLSANTGGNLLSFLLRCGTRPYERGTQWDSKSLV